MRRQPPLNLGVEKWAPQQQLEVDFLSIPKFLSKSKATKSRNRGPSGTSSPDLWHRTIYWESFPPLFTEYLLLFSCKPLILLKLLNGTVKMTIRGYREKVCIVIYIIYRYNIYHATI